MVAGNMKEELSFEGFMAVLAIWPFLLALRGWVLSVLWGWFVVPLGVAQIGVAHSIGISVLWNAIDSSESNSKDMSVLQALLAGSLNPLLALAFGWVFHSMM